MWAPGIPGTGEPMATRPSFGVNLFVQDIDKNLEYFTNTLGFRLVERYAAPDGTTFHATVAYGNGAKAGHISLASIPGMMSAGEGPTYDFGTFGQNVRNSPQTLGNGVVLYFHVPNVDKVFAKINAKGAIVDEPPTDQFWGERTISVLTPDNYYITFSQPIKGWKANAEMIVERPKAGRTAKRAPARGAKAKKGRR